MFTKHFHMYYLVFKKQIDGRHYSHYKKVKTQLFNLVESVCQGFQGGQCARTLSHLNITYKNDSYERPCA